MCASASHHFPPPFTCERWHIRNYKLLRFSVHFIPCVPPSRVFACEPSATRVRALSNLSVGCPLCRLVDLSGVRFTARSGRWWHAWAGTAHEKQSPLGHWPVGTRQAGPDDVLNVMLGHGRRLKSKKATWSLTRVFWKPYNCLWRWVGFTWSIGSKSTQSSRLHPSTEFQFDHFFSTWHFDAFGCLKKEMPRWT